MQQSDSDHHPTFSSRIGFILVTAGAAVGLGNVWSFTYVAGKNGGGGFVLVYLLTLLFIAAPVFMAELLLGRMGRASTPTGLKKLQVNAGSKLPWALPAWVGLVASIFVLSFYSVIAGQVMAYGFEALKGGFAGWSADQIVALDASFKANPLSPIFWSALFILLAAAVVSLDVRAGLERTGKWLMPILLFMLVGLVGFAAFKADFAAGFNFLFGFREITLSPHILLEAVGQAFFTLSVGVGGIMLLGSYMGKDVHLPKASAWIIMMDLSVALLAGLAIFPLLFSAGMDPAVGPGLVFVTLPLVFADIPGGALLAFVFFLLLSFAAFTSAISLLATPTARMEESGISRGRSAWYLGGSAFALSLLTTLSFSSWQDFYPLAFLGFDGMTFFDLIREGVNNIVLPLGGLAFALMVGWGLKRETVREALPMKNQLFFTVWYGVLRYLVPIAITALFVTAMLGE